MLFWSLFSNIARIWSVLVTPFLGTKVRDALYEHVPPGSRATKYTYLAIGYPIGYFMGGLGLVLALVLLVAVGIVLPVITAVIIGFWATSVFMIFVLWLAFYRYPVFEIIYPRLRTKILFNNARVYSKLPGSPPSIRLLRLQPGSAMQQIVCDLVDGPLSDMEFEALSYVWGVALRPYTIRVNNKPFYVTYNLHSALTELRYPDHERLLWVDAICINQHDNTEKSLQVQMMRDIYAKASKVVVWLGKSTKATASTFDFLRQFGNAGASERDTVWNHHTTQSTWRNLRNEFIRIFDHDWWSRAWIIQEIVVGRNVVMQRGRHKIEWEAVHSLFTYSPFGNDEFGDFEAPMFAKNIQSLRTEANTTEAPSTMLGELVSRFRFQSATFGSDKIYALLGLLKADNPSLIIPDYSKSPDEVFMQFTASYILHSNNLDILSLAVGTELQSASWCRDWRLNHDGYFETYGLLMLEPHTKPFSASGSHGPVQGINFERNIVSLRGYDADTVTRVGGFHQKMGGRPVDWDLAFRSWELIAGEYLGEEETSESRDAFNRALTADCWHVEPTDWRKKIVPRRKQPRDDEEKRYLSTVENGCINRRFFVTEKGRFGLGPWNVKRGDAVCILLGGKTPFILRRCKDSTFETRRVLGSRPLERCYKLVGEAFVDGLMYYEGSMKDDVASGKILTDWFHLS
jgi:hypothetical protein